MSALISAILYRQKRIPCIISHSHRLKSKENRRKNNIIYIKLRHFCFERGVIKTAEIYVIRILYNLKNNNQMLKIYMRLLYSNKNKLQFINKILIAFLM